MRRFVVLSGRAALWACGGDDGGDVTGPPPPAPNFALTIQATGTGSGHVRTAAGITPPLDCASQPSAQPVTICSAAYPARTRLTLTATADSGSTFVSWAAGASVCGSVAACTLELRGNLTVLAVFDTAPPPGPVQPERRGPGISGPGVPGSGLRGVEITSWRWEPDPEFDWIEWVVEVRNTTAEELSGATVGFTFYDAAGNVVGSSTAFFLECCRLARRARWRASPSTMGPKRPHGPG